MKPGRELDALVAETVMGEKIGVRKADPLEFPLRAGSIFHDLAIEPEPYSTDVAAAWEVVTHMNMEREWLFSVRQYSSGKWRAMFFTPDVDGPYFRSVKKEMPHAICLAALKAVGAL